MSGNSIVTSSERSQRKVRVALIDDAPEVLRFMRLYLARDETIEVVGEADNGREGLEMVERVLPDVLLLDLAMPEMDGLDVLRELQDRDIDGMRIVVVSGLAQADLEETSVELGAARYVEKADGFDDLPAVIREVAANRG